MKLLSTNASDKPLYAAIGLPADATPEQIHAAFLNISRAHHPDIPQGDADIFQKARRAHEILIDPVKRRVYDETGLDADNDECMVRALGLIRNIVAGILNDGNIDINIPERLRTQMRAEAGGIEAQIRQVEAKIERIEKMLGNITKRWHGSLQVKNTLLSMLKSNLKVARTERAPMDAGLEIVKLAVKLIEDARYENDPMGDAMFGLPVQFVRFDQYPWTR